MGVSKGAMSSVFILNFSSNTNSKKVNAIEKIITNGIPIIQVKLMGFVVLFFAKPAVLISFDL